MADTPPAGAPPRFRSVDAWTLCDGIADDCLAKAADNGRTLPDAVRRLMFALMADPTNAACAACLSDELAAYATAPAAFVSRADIADHLEDAGPDAVREAVAALSACEALPPKVVYVRDGLSADEVAEYSRRLADAFPGRRHVVVHAGLPPGVLRTAVTGDEIEQVAAVRRYGGTPVPPLYMDLRTGQYHPAGRTAPPAS